MIKLIKKNKILLLLIILTIISFIIGFVFNLNLSLENKHIVSNNINNFFDNSTNIIKSFFLNQFVSNTVIWLFGISIIGIFIVIILYSMKVFIYSFELCSLFSSLGVKHLLGILLYYIPSTIMIIFSFFITYYSILLSSYLFRFLFLKTKFSFNYIIKKYILIFIFFLFGLILSTILNYINITYLINFY